MDIINNAELECLNATTKNIILIIFGSLWFKYFTTSFKRLSRKRVQNINFFERIKSHGKRLYLLIIIIKVNFISFLLKNKKILFYKHI